MWREDPQCRGLPSHIEMTRQFRYNSQRTENECAEAEIRNCRIACVNFLAVKNREWIY